MKKLQDQLKSISKSLVVLSKKVATITKHVEKLQTKTKAAAKKKAVKRAPARKAAKKAAKQATAKKTVARKKTAAQKPTVLESVYKVVSASKAGAAISEIKAKTGLEARQLSNALYKLTKQGKITAATRGVYVKK
jgi:hypothetical protein